MAKTIAEINEKIKSGKVVVVTAEEVIDIAREKGIKRAAEEIDVVTTGTFGCMCSSGVLLNIGHTTPRMKITRALLNKVPAYCGLAAVDLYLGAAECQVDDPLNRIHPGEFSYGGGHVIHDLVAGKDIRLEAEAYGTDCYPRKTLVSLIKLSDLNEAILINPRNSYQNYNVAVNLYRKEVIYTYLGPLKPGPGNANYSSAGQLSPLLNDPKLRTIGVGTRVFLGGGIGYVFSQGTQHSPQVIFKRGERETFGGATLALTGDLKQMDPRWLVGASITGYGVSLFVGVGIPIPILDEETLYYTAVSDEEIFAPIVDYSRDYPQMTGEVIGFVSYKELRSGKIRINKREVPTASMSSYPRALEIAGILKRWIQEKRFYLTEPVASLPGPENGYISKPFKERPPEDTNPE